MKLFFLATISAGVVFFSNAQTINTVVGGGFSGMGDGGPATSAQLDNVHGVVFDGFGNMFIADGNHNRVRKVTPGSNIITTFAGGGTVTTNGGPATLVSMDGPWDVKVDAAGNVYIAEEMNHCVRMVNAATGAITRIAGGNPDPLGQTGGYNGDGIPADTARIYGPMGIALDQAGNVYIAEYYGNRIRKVTKSTGLISTVAGNGSNTYNGDNILAVNAAVFAPSGVALDAAGNIYIAENGGYRLRKVNAATGIISTIAGNGGSGFSGDGGLATAAQVQPSAIVLDPAGNIYMTSNNRVRKINASTGIITTIAGDGNYGFSGDGGPAIQAQLKGPNGITLDASGNVYIGDAVNNRVRRISIGQSVGIPYSHVSGGALLFPNPTEKGSIMTFPQEIRDGYFSMTDATGKLVSARAFTGDSLTISGENLPPGIYNITVAGPGGEALIVRKLVIE